MNRRTSCFSFVIALTVWLSAGEECHAALASRLDGARPRYTARLASNKALRKQQLIVDPEGIIGGSASVAYDTSVVRLVGAQDPGDFEITSGLVGVVPSIGSLSQTLVPIDDFFNSQATSPVPPPGATPPPGDTYREQGYVQIFFDRRDTPSALAAGDGASVIPNLPGYVTVGEDGPTGVNDTHVLVFEYLPGVEPSARSAYTVYATPPRDLTVPDTIIPAADPDNPITYERLGPARVFGSLGYDEPRPRPDVPSVPLPPAGIAGGILLGLLAVRSLRRRTHP